MGHCRGPDRPAAAGVAVRDVHRLRLRPVLCRRVGVPAAAADRRGVCPIDGRIGAATARRGKARAGRRAETSGSRRAEAGGRQSDSSYQFTLWDPNLDELLRLVPVVVSKIEKLPELVDVTTDREQNGLQAELTIDRPAAARLGVRVTLAGGLLLWGSAYVHNTVQGQLDAQQITFPPAAAFAHPKAGSEITHIINDLGGRVYANTPAGAMRQTLVEYKGTTSSRKGDCDRK